MLRYILHFYQTAAPLHWELPSWVFPLVMGIITGWFGNMIIIGLMRRI